MLKLGTSWSARAAGPGCSPRGKVLDSRGLALSVGPWLETKKSAISRIENSTGSIRLSTLERYARAGEVRAGEVPPEKSAEKSASLLEKGLARGDLDLAFGGSPIPLTRLPKPPEGFREPELVFRRTGIPES